MRFIKGVVIGSLITTGMLMMYAETNPQGKKKIMKKGRQMIKKIGII